VMAQAVVETFASVQAAGVAATTSETTSCAAQRVVVLGTFAFLSCEADASELEDIACRGQVHADEYSFIGRQSEVKSIC